MNQSSQPHRPIRRVALVTAPYHSGVVESAGTWLNVGFVYIAGALREAGYEVDYYDAMAKWDDWDAIRTRLTEFRPDVVATSAFTAAIVVGTELLKLAREIDPQVITVIGNVHATFSYQELLEHSHDVIDYIIRGEGEVTMPALLDALNRGDDPSSIRGIAYYRRLPEDERPKGATLLRTGSVVATPPAPFIQDLDSLPTAWDLVEWPIYTYRAKNTARLAIVSSSRGCMQNCSFCSQKLFWNKSWRARSPENFVAELEMLRDRHGV